MKSEHMRKLYIRFKGRGLKRSLSSVVGKEEVKTVFMLFPEQLEKGHQTVCGSPELIDEITS